MPTERLSMRRIRDLLRLKHAQKLSDRAIAASLGMSHGAVGGYLQRARSAGGNGGAKLGHGSGGIILLRAA